MYNFFTFKKEARLNGQRQKIKKEYCREGRHRRELNSELSQTYRKRIEGFVMGMIDKPIQVTEFKDQKYEPRSESASKFIGAHALCINGFKREKNRIDHEVQKNEILDDVPFRKSSSHKFRELSRGSAAMHYKPHTTERVEEALRSDRHNEIQTVDYVDKIRKFSSNEQHLKQLRGTIPIKRASNRNILPILHKKSHFKSMATIYNEYPYGCFKTKVKDSKDLYDEEDVDDRPNNSIHQQRKITDHSKTQKMRTVTNLTKRVQKSENFNSRQTSKEALIRCNLLAVSPSTSPNRLRGGQGKQVHSDGLTYKQLYNTLYKGQVKLAFMR